jgi:tetratricopeptide (TPR) repeat protein
MKALAKERSRRYETASALARDIERYLRDEPVLAGPPSASYRLRKYARKYRKTLITAAAFLVLLVAATITSIALASLALRERNHSQAQKRSAEVNFKRALDAVDQMLTRVGEVQLSHVPQMELVRRDLLQDALRFYQEFLRERADSTIVRAEAARAYRRVGQIQDLLGQRDESEAAYRRSVDLLENLVAESQGDASLLSELAGASMNLGMLYHSTKRWSQAESCLQKAVSLREGVDRLDPTFLKNREQLATCYSNMVVLYRQMGRLDEAETAFRKSLVISDSLLSSDPKNFDYLSVRALSYNNVALVYGAQGRTSDAISTFQKALALNQQLVRDQPAAVEARRRLGACYNNLGLLYARQKQHDEAEDAYRQSLAIKEATLRDYPNVVLYMVDLAGAYGNIAIEVRRRSPEEALEWSRKAIAIYESVLHKDPRYVDARVNLFDALMSQAYALRKLDRLDEAAESWQRAIEISDGHPHINMRLYRPLIFNFLGEHARAATEAEALVAEGHTEGPNLVLFAAAYSNGSAAAAEDERLSPPEQKELADKYGARAVELLRQAAAAGHFRNAGQLANLENSDFDPIRPRGDFQELLSEVEKTAASTRPLSTHPRSL